jgi:ankyrin repeat protein
LFKAEADVILFLIRERPKAAKKSDKEGMTPLHLVCDADSGIDLAVVEELVEVFPGACSSRSSRDGSTPLSLAIANQAPVMVLRALASVNDAPFGIADDNGRLPLHVAVAVKSNYRTFRFLVKGYPEAKTTKNKVGETAYMFAKRMKLEQDILVLLAPNYD